MTSRTISVLLVVFAIGLSSCAADDIVAASPTSTRVPISRPPDPGPAPTHDGLTTEVRDRVVKSTVWIHGLACGRDKTGSGFAIGPDLVATAAHVIAGVDRVEVTRVDGKVFEGIPVVFDPMGDLAILRVVGLSLTPLPLGTAADGTVGALIGWERDPRPDPTPFRIDRPLIVEIAEVGGTEKAARPSWLLAAYVDSGDSGAALVDSTGTVVGIVFATTKRDAPVAYAVRATRLEELTDRDLGTVAEVSGC